MIIDLIVFILLVVALFKGMSKGLVVAVFSFLAFIIGLAAAMKLSAVVAGYLGEATNISGKWLPVLAFLLVFIAVILLVRLLAKMIESALRLSMLGWVNRLGGFLFYALLYLFIYSILLFYATQLQVFKEETIKNSLFYPYLADIGPWVIEGIGVVLPFFRDMFGELSHFFEELSDKKP